MDVNRRFFVRQDIQTFLLSDDIAQPANAPAAPAAELTSAFCDPVIPGMGVLGSPSALSAVSGWI